MSNLDLIQHMFADVFERKQFDQTLIAKYFHPDYQQHVNGEVLGYENFSSHMRALRDAVNDIKIEFEQLIEDGDSACSVHYSSGTKLDGTVVKGKVIAFYKIKDGKIILLDELTRLVAGDEGDEALGAKH